MARDDDPATAPTLDARSVSETLPAVGLDATLVADASPRATPTGERDASSRYGVIEEIGRGGIGRVLLARDGTLEREVALKELLVGADGATIAGVGRFLREARITARLEHPGIVPVHDLGRRPDGSLFYTMKRVRGRSLARVLADARALEDRLKTLRAFRDVCDAIAYAHSHGVVHRDLKPDNVMIGEFGETVVLDWGIAKVMGTVDAPASASPGGPVSDDPTRTTDGTAIGTPSYMSPEQARGALAEIDERTDVWGLGAILFEILTGAPPFTGQTALSVLARVLTEAPPRVLSREPAAPRELAAITDRALAPDRASRYRTAKELADEIGAYLDGRAVRAYEYSSLELLRRFVARNRAATIAASLVLLATVAAGVFSFARYRDERVARAEAEARGLEAENARAALTGEVRATERALSEALVQRAETALVEHDPLTASVYALTALEHESEPLEGEAGNASVRARARSAFLAAEEHERWELVEIEDLGVAEEAFHELAMSPDGAQVGWARADGSVLRISGRDPITVPGAQVVAFTSDGEGFVDASPSGGVRALDGTLRFAFDPAPLSVATVAASGGVIAFATREGDLRVVDERTGRERMRVALAATPWTIALDPTGRYAAVLFRADARLVVFDFAGEQARTVLDRRFAWTPLNTTLDPEGAWVAVGGADDRVHVFWLSDGHEVALPAPDFVTGMRAQDAATIALVDWFGVRFVSIASGASTTRFPLPMRRVDRSVLRRAGDELWATLSSPTTSHRAVVAHWRRAGTGLAIARDVGSAIRDTVALPGALALVTGTAVLLLDATDRDARLIGRIEISAETGAAASDGTLAFANRQGAVWTVASGTTTAVLLREPSGWAFALALEFASDDRLLVSHGSRAIEEWDVRARRRLRVIEDVHRAAVYGISRSHDGQRIATASHDGRVCVLDARTLAVEGCIEGHEILASQGAFSPDDSLLATADGAGWVRIVDVATRATRIRFRAHGDWLNRVIWSPDGELLLTASDDGSGLFVVQTGEALRVRDTSGTQNGAFLDGGRLACAPHNSVIECFDVAAARRPIPEDARETAEERAGVELVGFDLVPRLDVPVSPDRTPR